MHNKCISNTNTLSIVYVPHATGWLMKTQTFVVVVRRHINIHPRYPGYIVFIPMFSIYDVIHVNQRMINKSLAIFNTLYINKNLVSTKGRYNVFVVYFPYHTPVLGYLVNTFQRQHIIPVR